jgi:hypothetical protein
MRLWPLLGAALLLACGSHAANAPSPRPPPWSAAELAAFKGRAMEALAEDVPDVTGAAIAMEKELDTFVERATAADDAGQLTTDPERESAGLALVYAAMYTIRDVHLVDTGKIAAERLYAAHRYGPSAGSLADAAVARAEGTVRRHRAFELLTRAQRLRPNDGRIASWIAAASAHEHSLPGGVLMDPDKGALLAAVEVEPIFNLFTALILLRKEPIDAPRGRALFDRTRVFLDAKMCQDVAPGSKAARSCQDGPLAPWNEEAATVMLSDGFVQRGEAALRRGDVPSAMPLLGMAKGLLASLDDDAHRAAASRWKYSPFADARRKRLAALVPGQPVPDPSFWTSDAYDGLYSCASCHVK